MNISLKKSKTTEREVIETELYFFDSDINKSIGKMEYSSNKKTKIGHIDFTYLQPEYRREGILKSFINEILCDIKCDGSDVVELKAITQDAISAWERLGFVELETVEVEGVIETRMGIDMFTKKCLCNKR